MKGRWLHWLGAGVAVATVVFAVVLASRFGADPGLVPSPLIGEPAPQFALPTLDGTSTVGLSDFDGDIVVVNFFASWCLQCRAEHDDLVATAEAFSERGVSFVQIAYQESPAQTLAYLDQAGLSETTRYLADPGSRTAIAYGVFGIPETFFIDGDGIVVGKLVGESNALILGATIDSILQGERPGETVTGDTMQSPSP
jgi:cytochrome c biogenesis protein CcmG/thiol:disulfide interchange protein DsbE